MRIVSLLRCNTINTRARVIYSVDIFISAAFDTVTFSGLLVFDYWIPTTLHDFLPFSSRL